MPQVKKWPHKANEMRENAIARMMDIEQIARDGMDSARKKGDADALYRLSEIERRAMQTKFTLQLAYVAGRE